MMFQEFKSSKTFDSAFLFTACLLNIDANHPVSFFPPSFQSEAAMQRYVEPFSDMVPIPHHFESDLTRPRAVMAFSKTVAGQEAAVEGGARVAGGVALIKEVQSGARDLNDFAFFVAEPDIGVELSALRGLLKKKYPSTRNGETTMKESSVLDIVIYDIDLNIVQGRLYVKQRFKNF